MDTKIKVKEGFGLRNYLEQTFNYDDENLVSAYDELPLWSSVFGLLLLEKSGSVRTLKRSMLAAARASRYWNYHSVLDHHAVFTELIAGRER